MKQYPEQITIKAGPYLDLKKLSLEDWLRCVRDGRCGDILCVYLLSLSTGVHTAVHLNNNKIWSTVKNIPASHDELIKTCDQHLAYLGFGIFLRLQKKPCKPRILRTVTGADYKTQQLLLQSISSDNASAAGGEFSSKPNIVLGRESQSETRPTGTMPLSSTKPKASAAVGSKAQLPRVKAELTGTILPQVSVSGSKLQLPLAKDKLTGTTAKLTGTIPSTSTVTTGTLPTKGEASEQFIKVDPIVKPEVHPTSRTEVSKVRKIPKAHLMPFQVKLTRLTNKEIEKYTHHQVPNMSLNQQSRQSPIVTRSATKAKQPYHKKRLITGRPSKLVDPTPTPVGRLHVHRHILRRHRHRIYLRCRVKGCTLAYISFNRIKDLNTNTANVQRCISAHNATSIICSKAP